MEKINCSIQSVEKLNHDVYQIKLRLPDNNNNMHVAGQYLDLYLPTGRSASFSIGSAPEEEQLLELHIRSNPDSEFTKALIAHLLVENEITAELAKGVACLKASDLADDDILVLTAASTGFSQVKSVVEHLIANQVKNKIHIYWGVRAASDLYWLELPLQWAKEHSNITYHPVVSDPTDKCEWTGRVDLIPAAVLQDFDDFTNVKMLASGSPDMVYALLDACETKGMQESQLLSDVLAYAPRK